MKTKSMRIKAVALSLTVLTMFGAVAPNMQPAKAAQTMQQTSSGKELDNYLKSIVPSDKKTLLVDKGTGAQLDMKPEMNEGKDDSFTIITREKEKAEDFTADIATIDGNLNGIYPGAVVHADSNLVDGAPDPVTNLDYKPVTVGIDINGNTQDPITVENPDQHTVNAAVNKQIDKWLESGKSTAARATYKSVMAYDEKQLETQLGVKNAAKTYGVDLKATIKGEKKEMLVCFNQVYYTAKVTPQTASKIFADNVTVQDLVDNGITKDNPGVAQVTSIDYGRQIVVKLSSNKLDADVEAAWNASVGVNKIENDNKFKEVMENTTFSVFAYGGSTETAGELITVTKDIDKVNEIIASDINFKKGSAACPMSYTTNFIDDGSRAKITKSTEYVKTNVEKHNQVKVNTDCANWYVTKHQKFYGRPIEGINEDGSYKLGKWKNLMDEGSGSKSFTVPGKYAEFGFSFDITGGTDWPYSDVFWTANKGAAKEINIEWGGGCRTAWIEIKVNGDQVVKSTNCSSHKEYDFGC